MGIDPGMDVWCGVRLTGDDYEIQAALQEEARAADEVYVRWEVAWQEIEVFYPSYDGDCEPAGFGVRLLSHDWNRDPLPLDEVAALGEVPPGVKEAAYLAAARHGLGPERVGVWVHVNLG